MNIARVAVLVVAVAAAGTAVVIVMNDKPQVIEAVTPGAPAPVVQTDQVLVASRDLSLGKILAADDMVWQPWPKDAVNAVMIKKSDNDKVVADLTGSIVKANLFQGEPIRRERLIKGTGTGFLSAILPSGMRAVAINIDSQGSTTAGGFILPNDRVDVVRTVKPETGAAGGTTEMQSDTILSNVKVLAIGQNVQDKDGQPTVVGSTATLELDPSQTETIILAQRTGQLSLVLRSLLDAAATGPEPEKQGSKTTTIVRYGVASESAAR